MSTYIRWGLFLGAVGIAGVYYYTSSGQRRRGRGWKPFTPAQAKRRENSRQRRDSREQKRREAEGYGADPASDHAEDSASASAPAGGKGNARNRKGKKKEPSKLGSNVRADEPQDDGQDEDQEDLEFARQLQDKMTGTDLKQKNQTQTKKARRQAKRAEAAVSGQKAGSPSGTGPRQETSTASSTTGADADDDLSSSTSLDLGPAPAAGNVSDMLEQPGKGPSVLNITELPKSQKQQKAQKPAQQPESKKARQNRQRREAEKAANDEAEAERRKLLENQRRTAREARGEPAKNGLGASQPPAQNAWTGARKAGGNANTLAKNPSPATAPPQLLDTFDEHAPTSSKNAHTNGADATEYGSLPSEEEQMKLLSEMDGEENGWATVSTKSGKKAKQKASNPQLSSSQSQQEPAPSSSSASKSERDSSTTRSGDPASIFPKGAPGTALNAQANGLLSASMGAKKGGALAGNAKKEALNGSSTTWNQSNIKDHPDYDPNFPYALVGHPLDSEWAV